MRPPSPHQLDYASGGKPISRPTLWAAGLLVFAGHCVFQFVLYRGRVVGHWSVAESDLVLFLAPLLPAVSMYAMLFWRAAAAKPWPTGGKVLYTIGCTLLVSFFSWWGSWLVPVNTYGT